MCNGHESPASYDSLSDAQEHAETIGGIVFDTKRPQVKIKLDPGAKAPEYAHDGDSGADLFALEEIYLKPHNWRAIRTGVYLELPEGYEAQVRSKSGLAASFGLQVLNGPGTIDNCYRGEIKVILMNHGDGIYHVKVGSKIAQLVIVEIGLQAHFHITDGELTETKRGDGGFGSTGR